MTQHHHEHTHGHQHAHQPKSQGLHKDWRTWAVILLMLAAMAAYVLSVDEEIVPGEVPGERAPAMAE
jgi:hypothetical protein